MNSRTYAADSENPDKEDRMPREYKLTKGDFVVQSKHADVSFSNDGCWALFWFDTPEKGKCLSIDYIGSGYPAVVVCVRANWKAKRRIARYRKEAWEEARF